MARRSNPNLLDIATMLPWPVGIALGAIVFAALRWVAPALAVRVENPITQSMFTAIADGALPLFAWILLAVFWFGALASFLQRNNRSRLLAARTDLNAIRALDWRQFEMLVGEAYRQQGYRVAETGLGGPDGGIDLVIQRDGQKTLVQCKHWRSRQIPVATVREMFGLLQHHDADAASIICTGSFSADARRFAVGKPIDLIGGDGIVQLIKQGRARLTQPDAAAAPLLVPVPESKRTQACGICGSEMVVRRNRRTGSTFLGCSDYPACRVTAETRQ